MPTKVGGGDGKIIAIGGGDGDRDGDGNGLRDGGGPVPMCSCVFGASCTVNSIVERQ